jgi:glycosyltransferase involved in cell wall biosynthesis
MPYRKYCIEHVDKIFPISQDACDFLTKKYGYKDKYILSRLGVQKRNVTTKASAPFNFQVLTISQLIQRKRIDLVLNALTVFALKNQDISIQWTHFGTGNMEKDLRMKVSSIDIPNMRTTFMGYVPNIEIIQFMEKSTVDVFMNLSTSEGVPVSIMEVQSYGIPVIATNVGGTGEIIDKDNGILLPSCPSLEDVVAALEKVYQSDFNRDIIKNHWNKLSNAQTNFRHFANLLSNTQ